jgi:ectoine hydroxylase-related dioxygenase (phytanoyl-CoA dioxygenase family)
MLHSPKISESQIMQFRQQGFLVLRDAFGKAETKKIQTWASEIAERREEIGKHWVYYEKSLIDGKKNLINRIENMAPYHRGLASLAQSFVPACGKLFGEEAVLFKDKINYKMSGGDGFKPHQDSQAGWEAYAKYFISVMVCIDEATLENGCIELVPRSNDVSDFKLIGREWRPLSEVETAKLEFKPYPTKPGDVIFIDSYAPHKSARNLTGSPRRLYFSTYNRLSEGDYLATYYADKRKTFPPDIERKDGKDYVYRV